MDVDSIPVGVDFRSYLRQAVARCRALIVVIGDNWLGTDDRGRPHIEQEGDFVRIEIEAALEQGIPIVPVLTS